jgi:hypothetical protein
MLRVDRGRHPLFVGNHYFNFHLPIHLCFATLNFLNGFARQLNGFTMLKLNQSTFNSHATLIQLLSPRPTPERIVPSVVVFSLLYRMLPNGKLTNREGLQFRQFTVASPLYDIYSE